MTSKQHLGKLTLLFHLLLTCTLAAAIKSSSPGQDSNDVTSYRGTAEHSRVTTQASSSSSASVVNSRSTSAALTPLSLSTASVSPNTQEKRSTLSSTAMPPTSLSSVRTTGPVPSPPSSTRQAGSSGSPTSSTLTPDTHSSLATGAPSSSSPLRPVTAQPTTANATAPPAVQHLGNELTLQEKIITGFTSVLLGLVLLGALLYVVLTSCKKGGHFRHQPLYDNSPETGIRFEVPDDTLLISGGLYDGPQASSPPKERSGYEEFPCRPSQFRLEFLHEERETEGPAMNTFRPSGEDV